MLWNIQLTWTRNKRSLIINMIIITIRKVHTAYVCREKEMKTVEWWSLNCSGNEIHVKTYETEKSIVVIIKHDSLPYDSVGLSLSAWTIDLNSTNTTRQVTNWTILRGIVRGSEWWWLLVGCKILRVQQHIGCHSGSCGVLWLHVLPYEMFMKKKTTSTKVRTVQ